MSLADLDALLVADENARARLESIRSRQADALLSARSASEERHLAAQAALETSLSAELAAIDAEVDAEIALRETARRRRHEQIEARAETLVAPAAALWVRIVEEGRVP